MPNNMKTMLTSVCLLIASMTASYANKIAPQFTPNNIMSVAVVINDNAIDGCWTNLGEVKRYAEDKLELSGFTVKKIGDEDIHYLMTITVNSMRQVFPCYGSVGIEIFRPYLIDGVSGIFVVAEGGATFNTGGSAGNSNLLVLKYLRQFFEAFPK
jgi:hypothetical protein